MLRYADVGGWGRSHGCALSGVSVPGYPVVVHTVYTQHVPVTDDADEYKVFCAGRQSALGALPDAGGQFFDLVEDLATFGHVLADLAVGVHDRGVVTAESLADLG